MHQSVDPDPAALADLVQRLEDAAALLRQTAKDGNSREGALI
jgi:hypothetical protein